MDEKKHINLIYQYNSNWIGGTYYITNIIKALGLLSDKEKPIINVIHNDKKSISSIAELNYPYINFCCYKLDFNIFEKVVNRISLELLGKITIKKKLPVFLKKIYPASVFYNLDSAPNYYWIPDFQEHYLPDFFSSKEIKDRKKIQLMIKNSKQGIIFSSKESLNDFNRFFPDNENDKEVLSFVSMISDADFKTISIENLKEKFNITKPYFIVNNQFWRHKNHIIVLEALKYLKKRKLGFQVVFTGKEYDSRNPNHIKIIKSFCEENFLKDDVLFLGFISRNEQLCLMKEALAVIQPSLFEGWSTVVEDAKALSKFLILSDIPVHREQVLQNRYFFQPDDAIKLASIMNLLFDKGVKIVDIKYNEAKLKFAENVIRIL